MITLTNAPGILEPVYTPFYYGVHSSLVLNQDFKYVMDVYYKPVTASTWNSITRLKYFPYNTDLTATFSPHRLLENFIGSNFNYYTDKFFTPAVSGLIDYKIRFSEEYSITAATTFSSITDNNGFAQLNFNAGQALLPTDTVRIYADGYNFYQTVKSGVTLTQYQLDTPYVGNVSGYSNFRLTTISGLTYSARTYASARDYTKPYDSRYTIHNLGYSPSDGQNMAMTDYSPTSKIRIRYDEHYPLTFLAGDSSNFINGFTILTYNGDYLAGYYYISNDHFDYSANTSFKRWTADVGCAKLRNNFVSFKLFLIYKYCCIT